MDKKPKVYLAAPYTHEQPFIMELVRLEVTMDYTVRDVEIVSIPNWCD